MEGKTRDMAEEGPEQHAAGEKKRDAIWRKKNTEKTGELFFQNRISPSPFTNSFKSCLP